MSNSLKLLISSERPEQIAHDCSFPLNDLSNLLTVTHLSWAKWAHEHMSNERMSEFPALLKSRVGQKFFSKECNVFVPKLPHSPQHLSSVQPITVSHHCFTHLHEYLVGPLTASSEGHTHVLSIIDWTTRGVEVLPLTLTTATACADALVAGWISLFGVPAIITTDQGWAPQSFPFGTFRSFPFF